MSDEVKDRINKKMEHAKVLSHEEVKPGVHSMEIQVQDPGAKGLKELAFLDPKGETSPVVYHTEGRIISRDFLRREVINLMITQPDPAKINPEQAYIKSLLLYRTRGAYATVIDTLTNFASKGFKNDIADEDIKLFYDTWNREIDFQNIVENIFFDFFRVGIVRTFKVVGKFDPKLRPAAFTKAIKAKASLNRLNTSDKMQELMGYRDYGAAKNIWSKSYIPLKYTILDPRLLQIQGPLVFDQTDTYVKPSAFKELQELLKHPEKQSKDQKEFISLLPKDFLKDVNSGKPIKLPPELVGKCDYRKQDYERYPLPRSLRIFDALDYKDALVKADFSTLDGITNYILKVTIGNDEHPVMDAGQLDAIAQIFNTPNKSFDVIWNHTLDIEKITFPEISQILGQGKFAQVNDDLTMGWGVSRALLDGNLQASPAAIEAALKSFTEEVNYARRCVKRWIDNEYEEIALAMGFDHYPNVRFDENALKDEIMLMSVVQGMIDRRIISYETGIEKLGMNFSNELANMKQEKPLVEDGVLGIIGSPYNPKALPPDEPVPTKDTTDTSQPTLVTQEDFKDFQKNVQTMIKEGIKNIQPQVQPVQRTPKGTPSEGRPRKGGAQKPKKKSTKPSVKPPK